jgi:hypothetical protein
VSLAVRSLAPQCNAPAEVGLPTNRRGDVQAEYRAPPPRGGPLSSSHLASWREVDHWADPRSTTCASTPRSCCPDRTKTRCKGRSRRADIKPPTSGSIWSRSWRRFSSLSKFAAAAPLHSADQGRTLPAAVPPGLAPNGARAEERRRPVLDTTPSSAVSGAASARPIGRRRS